MNNNNNLQINANKINKILESKRRDVNFTSFKILSILLTNYENRLEKDPSNTSNIVYNSKKQNQDMYNQNDLNSTVRSGAKYLFQGRAFYYTTVVQFLEQLVFGINSITIEITRGNNTNIHRLSIPFEVMKNKYDLIKMLVQNIKPLLDSKRTKKNKKLDKKIILNEELIVPDQKISIELENNTLPTIL